MLIVLLLFVTGLMSYTIISSTASKGGHNEEIPQANQPASPDSLTLNTDTLQVTSDTIQATAKSELPLIRTERYPGPPKRTQYPKKLEKGRRIDLNSADTLLLVRVPGIGPSFARRIYKYREILGGYYVVEQLQEVYGMDRERYDQIAPYMEIKTPPRPLHISRDSIQRHPYLQWRHVNVIRDLLRAGQEINWQGLMESGQFTHDDSLRLAPYLPIQ